MDNNKTIKKDKININGYYLFGIVSFVALIIIYLLILRLNYGVAYQDIRFKSNYVESFNSGFRRLDTLEEVDGNAILILNEGEEITLVKKLPHISYENRKLAFRTNGVSVRAYADEKGIYCYGLQNEEAFGKEVGLIYNTVDLRQVKAGDELKFVFKSYKNHATVNLKSFVRGSDPAITLMVLRNEALIIFGFVLSALWGVILIGCGLYFRLKGVKDAQEMSFIGFFAVFAAAWIFMDSTLFQFSCPQLAIKYQAGFYLFTVMFIPLVLIYRGRCEGSAKLLTVENFGFVVLLFMDTILYLCGIMPLSKSIVFTYALIGLIVITCFIYLIREAGKYSNRRLYSPMFFFLILVIAATMDLILYDGAVTDIPNLCFKAALLSFILLASASCFKSNSMVLREKRFMDHYKDLAFKDSVTDGYSQYYFMEEASKLIRNDRDYVIVYFDLQQFKMVNDTVGRKGGDEILKKIYQMLSESLNKDELMCHMGGGHFLFLIRSNEEKVLNERLYSFKKLINRIPVGGMDENRVNAICGVYYIQDDELSLAEMVDRAEMSRNEMRIEVIDGFGCAFFDDAIRDRLRRDDNLKNRILNGMESGEFKIYLQPKVDPMDGRVRGAEALARWMDPIEGMISPGEFIPVFENNGSIIQMNLFMLKGTIRIINSWIRRGITPPIVSVNLSKISIHNPLFMDEFSAIMEDEDTPTKYLEFEFTESMLYESSDKMNELVDKIHKWGSTCSIDDFGCSYSNLIMLKEIMVDALKLDRDFIVYKSIHKERALKIVETIVKLSHELSMEVVMEGVENEEQATFIKNCGCDMIQGFYYSKPLPVEEFEEYLISRK